MSRPRSAKVPDDPKHPGVIRYPSLGAFRASLLKERPPDSGTLSDGRSRGRSWDLGASWDDAERMAKFGWADGAKRVRAMAEKIRDALVPPETLAPAYDVAPFGTSVQLDMSRYVEGDPEHWHVYQERRGGKVSIYASVNALAFVRATSLERRGAVGLAVAWVLHDAGYEVELVGMKVNEDSRHGGSKAVGATWAMSMEPAIAAYWLTHPGAFRRHGFRWIELYAPWLGRCGSYGVTSPAHEATVVPPGAIHIKGLTDDEGWQSDDDAIATARKLLGSLDTTTIHS